MAVWSSLLRSSSGLGHFSKVLKSPNGAKVAQNAIQARFSGNDHRTFFITPSRFQWNKFKDDLHFYVMVGLIPMAVLILGTNIFVGPATLSPTPEEYVPKHWEYYRHPITRFLARYIYPSPQQEYEKMLHVLHEEQEKMQLRQLDFAIRGKMSERRDYQAYYYQPVMGKYFRAAKEAADYLESIRGD